LEYYAHLNIVQVITAHTYDYNVGENSCNSGDGTDQRGQSFMFMMMIYDYTDCG